MQGWAWRGQRWACCRAFRRAAAQTFLDGSRTKVLFFSQQCSLVRPRAAATGSSQRGPVLPRHGAGGEFLLLCVLPARQQPVHGSAGAAGEGPRQEPRRTAAAVRSAPAQPPARPGRAGSEQRSRGSQALHDENPTRQRGRQLRPGTGRTAALGTRTLAPRPHPRRPPSAMGNGMSQVTGSAGAAALQLGRARAARPLPEVGDPYLAAASAVPSGVSPAGTGSGTGLGSLFICLFICRQSNTGGETGTLRWDS